MGTTINGSRSWLMLGGMSIQPAEFAKLAVVIGMAMIIAERVENSRQRRVGAVDVALMGGDRRHPGAADHPAARPRHDAGAHRHRVRRARGRGRPAALADLAVRRRRRRGDAGRHGGGAQAVPDQPLHGLHRSRRSTRAARATTPPRRGSRSATAACSGRGCSTARRPARGSCPSSTPTSSSPSPARSSA